MSKHDVYRIADAIYRVQELLFRMDDELRRSRHASFQIARMRTTGAFGAAVGGLLAILPIVLDATGTKLTEGPAMVSYAVILLIIALWITQIRDARAAEREMGLQQQGSMPAPLGQRQDYLLERVTQYAYRARLLKEILGEDSLLPDADRERRDQVLKAADLAPPRYEEVLRYCLNEIKAISDQSQGLVLRGARERELHDQVILWAEPYLPREYVESDRAALAAVRSGNGRPAGSSGGG